MLIANPVSGTKLWEAKRKQITSRLSEYYDLTVYTTSEQVNGTELAKEALELNLM